MRTWANGWGEWFVEFEPSGNPKIDHALARAMIAYELESRGINTTGLDVELSRDNIYGEVWATDRTPTD